MRASTELMQQLKGMLSKPENPHLPLYQRLYEAIRQQILDGLLLPGMALPSSRVMAKQLGIARNTVVTALEQLCAEGFAIARPKSGIYISSTIPVHWKVSTISTQTKLTLSARGEKIATQAKTFSMRGAFAVGVPDLKLFPYSLWQRYTARQARNPKLAWQINPHSGGHIDLRLALADYLRIARGIQCDAAHILITHGTQHSLQLVADLLADVGDKIIMENPGYPGARCAFDAAGLTIIFQPVDQEGIAIAANTWRKKPRLIYTTPSHQYPTGVVMSAARRRQLLASAVQHQTWVIEDDYDSEFRYVGKPIAALQALAPSQVIYLGTFSKTFFPALQIGYMVLPEHLVDTFRTTNARHLREPSYVIQKALADFMRDGHASTHIRKMRQEYHARCVILSELLQRELGDLVQLGGLDTGLHLVAYLPHCLSDVEITKLAYQQGIIANPLSQYYASSAQGGVKSGLVLGFGDTDEKNIVRAGKKLCEIIIAAARL